MLWSVVTVRFWNLWVSECHPIFAEKELLDTTQLKYDVTSPVGTGQYGNVYKGEMLSNGGKEWRTVAIKVAKGEDVKLCLPHSLS